MTFVESIDREHLHHAYLIEGEYASLLPDMLSFLHSAFLVAHEGNPNVAKESYELFTIDHARSLRSRQGESAAGGGKKFFIIGIRFFTREAEHALLKMFEEPSPETHFFLIMPNTDTLLPTLRSRLFTLRALNDDKRRRALCAKGETFLRLSKPERLSYIASMLEEYEDEERHEYLKGEALSFLDGIECALRASQKGNAPGSDIQSAFAELLRVKSYMRDRGASTKMLLEHCALLFD